MTRIDLELVQRKILKTRSKAKYAIENKMFIVMTNPSLHINIINDIISEFSKINYGNIGLAYSPIKRGSGNIEYLAYFKKSCKTSNINIPLTVKEAFLKLK